MQWLDEVAGVVAMRHAGDISGGNCGSGQSSVQACDL